MDVQVVLGRWCRQEDVVVGLPYSGRTRSQLEGLVAGLAGADLTPMSLGLSHSLSRYKLKFSPDKVGWTRRAHWPVCIVKTSASSKPVRQCVSMMSCQY